ncbi:PREDICTED: TP53-target gene 5 protein [Myotis brandtii]|uniref:TP53-target gene 5 protein n=1 Tax=Myotis brandtii TaxID=109478 RepID=UPI000703FCE7|nr:PREDICTED: TP53-target gene 5 protein [Myotis brandtii]
MQDEEPQDKIQQPISKLTERNRLRMVLKNLSLLRLLKNSNPRIQELYSLARRCWNSLLNVRKVLPISSRHCAKEFRKPNFHKGSGRKSLPFAFPTSHIPAADRYHIPCPEVQGLRVVEKFLSRPSPAFFTGSPELAAQQLPWGQAREPGLSPALLTAVPLLARNNTVCTKMGQNNGLQEAKCSKKKLESKNLGKPKKLKSKVRVPEKKKVQQSPAAVPEGEQQVEPEVPKTSITCPGAWGRQLPTGDPGVIFLKPHRGDAEQLKAADQWNWFEGLPRRIHLPGPRVMCRPSTMRLVKRCCTRFCSASLGLPKCHPYRV